MSRRDASSRRRHAYTTYDEGGIFPGERAVELARAAGQRRGHVRAGRRLRHVNGQNVFTHGIQIGLARNESHDLQTATEELIDAFARGNPDMGRPSRYERITVDGRPGAADDAVEPQRGDAASRRTSSWSRPSWAPGSALLASAWRRRNEFNSYRHRLQSHHGIDPASEVTEGARTTRRPSSGRTFDRRSTARRRGGTRIARAERARPRWAA